MSEVATHCPYIGLKQNRAIRFSTPTAEHRCYISGDAMDIPVDQASYCLTQFHTQCPLYMGSLAQHNNGGRRAAPPHDRAPQPRLRHRSMPMLPLPSRMTKSGTNRHGSAAPLHRCIGAAVESRLRSMASSSG